MVSHPNFYENINEALMRLRGTIVLYDGEPYYVCTISDHKNDGKFRVYMVEVSAVTKMNMPCLSNLPHPHPAMGTQMDMYVDGQGNPGKDVVVIRKNMDSPKFNKFRPFPLGMMNSKGAAVYVERKPLRPKTEQGLTQAMLEGTRLSACMMDSSRSGVMPYTQEFKDCVLGDYPSPNECLAGLKADNVNYSVGFTRNFALIRGPIDMLFLGYKRDVVGALVNGDFTTLKLGRNFKHLKEVCQELNLFVNIQ